MNLLNTLYFPGTDIHSVRQYPLFLMFQKVHLITPVEGDPVEGGKESPDSFIKSGFCQVHTPCPLGKDRNRFLRLVEDIKMRRDDYAAQLSSLTLASMSGTHSSTEESERTLIRSLFTPAELQAQNRDREEAERLWQARLVLAIGELLDHEEEEIAMHMAMLEEEEKDLFKELQGDDEAIDEGNPFAELSLMKSKLQGTSAGNIKKRFKAWRTLFLASSMEECSVFLTTSPDGGELLLEMYEKKTGQPATPVAELPLPAFVGWNTVEAGQMVRNFSEKNRELLSQLEGILNSLAQGEDVTGTEGEKWSTLNTLADPWGQALTRDFPAETFGRIPVRLYLLPDSSCSALLGKAQPVHGKPVNSILAVVG
ncbi:MAG: hypothetical protein VR65_16440 [Desulfobulbaceae bacterium BRH_c16a]|nr:MAG: hypothetical protein VR65_16440 [Desulfobulbaceae bacterium BRH_c16a]